MYRWYSVDIVVYLSERTSRIQWETVMCAFYLNDFPFCVLPVCMCVCVYVTHHIVSNIEALKYIGSSLVACSCFSHIYYLYMYGLYILINLCCMMMTIYLLLMIENGSLMSIEMYSSL